jgi:hypothetical protein
MLQLQKGDGGNPLRKALVLSLPAFLVQKYKYGQLRSCVPGGATGATAMYPALSYSVYLLCWYKSANTDAEGAPGATAMSPALSRNEERIYGAALAEGKVAMAAARQVSVFVLLY